MLISPDPGWGINLRNKYIFWDIDGTLVEYRFNGHVSDPEGTDNGMSLKERLTTEEVLEIINAFKESKEINT